MRSVDVSLHCKQTTEWSTAALCRVWGTTEKSAQLISMISEMSITRGTRAIFFPGFGDFLSVSPLWRTHQHDSHLNFNLIACLWGRLKASWSQVISLCAWPDSACMHFTFTDLPGASCSASEPTPERKPPARPGTLSLLRVIGKQGASHAPDVQTQARQWANRQRIWAVYVTLLCWSAPVVGARGPLSAEVACPWKQLPEKEMTC